ncbi:transmembrane protein 89 [Erinaceus europaeus]|uniref:Transmembrane protein 89 n=1 Tax=Erinaceus europaeus TaxID=9365 RepID=A0A1S3AE96_ERIEU|nr:transmembrane protein 89 [Erinaceus europaeus]
MPHALPFLLLLALLALPSPAFTWSRPLWYQVGLDLQPWGCQPNPADGCAVSLGCPGSWMSVEMSRLYPVAGVTLTTTMMLVLGRAALQRRRSLTNKAELPPAVPSTPGLHKRKCPISDRALLCGVLHMLDALLLHIERHLQHLATQRQSQIKGTPAQSG